MMPVHALAVLATQLLAPELRDEVHADATSTVQVAGAIWWIGARLPHRSEDGGRSWERVHLPAVSRRSHDRVDVLRLFDERRGLAAGWLGEAHDRILRTEDGGATWLGVELPVGLSVSDLQVEADGRAWLTGSSGDVLASDDHGATWRALTRPFTGNVRTDGVRFASPERGAVGAVQNALALTEDGGRTWRPVPTPADGLVDDEREPGRIASVRFLGSHLVVLQELSSAGERGRRRERHAYVAPWPAASPWRELRVRGEAVTAFEVGPTGLAAFAREAGLTLFSERLEPRWHVPHGLPRHVFRPSLASDGERWLAFDGDARLSIVEDGAARTIELLSSDPVDPASFEELVRDGRGGLWARTRAYVYRPDGPDGLWRRASHVPRTPSWWPRPTGGLLLWGGDGARALVDSTGAVVERPAESPFWPFEILRQGDLWFARGAEFTDREWYLGELGTTHGSWIHPSVEGLVLASGDGGATWAELDRWPGGAVTALWLTEANDLVVYRAGGGVRRGRVVTSGSSPPMAAMRTLVEPDAPGAPSLIASPNLFFTAEDEGWLEGARGWHGDTDCVLRTLDGGRTWSEIEARGWVDRIARVERLADGTIVALSVEWTGERVKHDAALVWRDGAFEVLRDLEPDVLRVVPDASGELVLELEDHEVGILSSDGRAWTRLRAPVTR